MAQIYIGLAEGKPAEAGKRFNCVKCLCRLDEAAVNNFLCHYAQARHQGELQDKEFYDNPNKKAAMRNMRQGKDHHNGNKCLVIFPQSDYDNGPFPNYR